MRRRLCSPTPTWRRRMPFLLCSFPRKQRIFFAYFISVSTSSRTYDLSSRARPTTVHGKRSHDSDRSSYPSCPPPTRLLSPIPPSPLLRLLSFPTPHIPLLSASYPLAMFLSRSYPPPTPPIRLLSPLLSQVRGKWWSLVKDSDNRHATHAYFDSQWSSFLKLIKSTCADSAKFDKKKPWFDRQYDNRRKWAARWA